jgi:peptide/nickel transport system substrate-binding protein
MAKGTRMGLRLTILGVAGALALAACGSSGGGTNSLGNKNTAGGFGRIPAATGTPSPGGTVTYALSPGATPNWIFPISDGNHNSIYNTLSFQNLMWRPLYWSFTGASPQIDYSNSVADKPTFADSNKTITFKLDKGYKWSDGRTVNAQDVLFGIAMSKAAVKEGPAVLANYTPGEFPDNIVSATAPDPQTVVLKLNKTFNSTWLLDNELNSSGMGPLPSTEWNLGATGGPHLDFNVPANAKKIFDYLTKQSQSPATFASNPLWQTVDGPYKLKSFNASTGANVLVPNGAYTGPQKSNLQEIDEVAYTSTQAEWNDVLSGKLDVGFVDPTDLPQLKNVAKKGYNYYGLPSTGFNYMYFNFNNTTNNINNVFKQLYVRQAFAHLENQPAIIKGVYQNAAVPGYSTIGVLPKSNFTASAVTTNPFPFSVAAAKKLFTDHGWQINNGVLTCQTAGTGANQCGANIPKGQTVSFTFWYANDSAALGQIVQSFASAAKQVGITANLKAFTFNQLLQTADDINSKSTTNQWGISDFGGFTNILYPTSDTIFNSNGSNNFGAYKDPQLDQLINNSVFGTDPNAVAKEATYIANHLPVIFEPERDRIWVWKNNIQGTANSFANLSQGYLTPEYWYLKK